MSVIPTQWNHINSLYRIVTGVEILCSLEAIQILVTTFNRKIKLMARCLKNLAINLCCLSRDTLEMPSKQ